MVQKKGPIKMLCGNFIALLQIASTYRKRLKDADNRMKAPLDFCTQMGLIEDDHLLDVGTFMWCDPKILSDTGCRLTLWSVGNQ